MPLVRGRKRRAEPEDDGEASSQPPSPEPQTQRRRTQVDVEDDEASAGDDDAERDDAEDNTTPDQFVKRMVRLALACEYSRRPIRRIDISEKVLGPNAGRQFRRVFDATQVQLRHVFGMEMVELPAKEKLTVQQKRAAATAKAADGAKTKQTPGVWILRSILPAEFNDPQSRSVPAVPTQREESVYVGIYSVLISLIQLSGGQIPDAKMERFLKRLKMQDRTQLDGENAKTEKLLKRMEKEGYIVKVRESAGPGNEEDVSWTVGPRGKMEVGIIGTKGLVKEVYNFNDGSQEQEDLERRLMRSLGIGERGVEEVRPPEQPRRRGRPRRGEQANQENEDEEDDSEDSD